MSVWHGRSARSPKRLFKREGAYITPVVVHGRIETEGKMSELSNGFLMQDTAGDDRERAIRGHENLAKMVAGDFIGDYIRDGKPWVQYRIYTFTDNEVRLEFIFRTPVERFEELRAALDSVAENLETE